MPNAKTLRHQVRHECAQDRTKEADARSACLRSCVISGLHLLQLGGTSIGMLVPFRYEWVMPL